MKDDGGAWEIVSPPDAHQAVVEAIKKLGVEPDTAQIAMLPQNYIKLEGRPAQQMLKLMEALEDHDDTQERLVELRRRGDRKSRPRWREDLRDRSRVRPHRLRLRRDGRHPAPPGDLRRAVDARRGRRFPIRLQTIHDGLTALLAAAAPDCVVIENLFHARNVRSALVLGHARGVGGAGRGAGAVCRSSSTRPAEIKLAVAGYGRAEKPQLQHMVKLLLGLDTAPSPHDAADALAVAICHAHSPATPGAAARAGARRRAAIGAGAHVKLASICRGVRRRDRAPLRHAPRKTRAAAGRRRRRRRLRRARAALDVLRRRRAGRARRAPHPHARARGRASALRLRHTRSS